MTRSLPVAALKRDFRRVLDAAQRGEETVVLRNGEPVARVAPLPPGTGMLGPERPGGLAAAAGLFSGWVELEEDVAAIISARGDVEDRTAFDPDGE